MQIKDQLKQLKPYQPGKPIEEVKKEYQLDKIVKLASNENPFGCSAHAKDAIQGELDQLAIYPDGYSATLRTELAEFLDVGEKQLIFGNGSDELVQIIARAFLDKHTNTVIPAPSFPQYRHNAVIEQAEIREVSLLEGGAHDLQGMLDAIDEKTKVVWVCNPNNPTGNHLTEKELVAFLDKVPDHVLVVLDEAYFEYVRAEDFPNSLSLLDTYRNIIVLRTFSKAYGLAALRVGYGVASEELITAIEPTREPFNTSRIAQAAARAAIKDQDFIQSCRQKNEAGLLQYQTFADRLGLFIYPSQTNFVLIDFKRDADELFNALLKKGYIVRSGKALGFPTCLRITVGTAEQNEEILKTLADLLEGIHA
ncbi:histidinol-phosphate transaminase [Bacillus sp. 179-C3.3 HS]|uniref:histidinol-phosphate transaminase n=1 Tax=Bacillus sp. 179-C3.3 HS TaxID=3232162 RepID=UPI0039A1C827